jgi:hypothetical protein
MQLPGFTADASLYASHGTYRSTIGGAAVGSEMVVPQLDCERRCYLNNILTPWKIDNCRAGCRVEIDVTTGTIEHRDCVSPPAGCHYEGQVLSGPPGTTTCGTLVCGPLECASGDQRSEACYTGGRRGTRTVRCNAGRWQPGPCVTDHWPGPGSGRKCCEWDEVRNRCRISVPANAECP